MTNVNQFKTGYECIDRNMTFSATDLICIAGRPAMGCTTFALNIMLRNKDAKGCFISLVDTEQKVKRKIDIITASQTETGNNTIDFSKTQEIDFKFLELATTLELIEFIVLISNDYDYFVIDSLSYINLNTESIFSKNKNYQEVVRYLKSACSMMKKNIILLSSTSHEIEEESKFSFSYYGIREKYFDHIITIAKPEYYGIKNDEFGRNYEKGETIVCIAKTRSEKGGFETSLRFNKDSLEFESQGFFDD